MTAERMPQSDSSLLAKPSEWVTRLAVRYPWRTLALAATLGAVSLLLAGTQLTYRTARSDLLNPRSEYHQNWLDYTKEFGEQEDVVVVIEGRSRETVGAAMTQIAAALSAQPRFFQAVLHEVDLSRVRSKGLYYLQPSQLAAIECFLTRVPGLLAGSTDPRQGRSAADRGNGSPRAPGTGEGMPHMAGGSGREDPSAEMLSALNALQGASPAQALDCLGMSPADASGSIPLIQRDGRMGLVLLRLTRDEGENFARNTDAIEALRRIVAHVQTRHQETKIGLTGLPIMENDEMQASQASSNQAGVIAMVGVIFVFVVGFGGFRHPLLANIALWVGTLWAMGYVTLAFGRLNILSIAFGAILIGQGSDFGIYYVARYLQLRRTSPSPTNVALIETGRSAGPSIADGALGTAAAFFMAGLTDFTGVAELGMISGGGIILCWLSTMIVLPAMIQVSDANRPWRKLPEPLDLYAWLRPLYAKPRLTLALTFGATLFLAASMSRLWYDHNLHHLQAAGLESIELERKLVEQSDKSVYFAISIAESRAEVQARKTQFLALPSVERVEEIATVLPVDEEQKRPIIERIHQRLVELAQVLRLPDGPGDEARRTADGAGQDAAGARGLGAGRGLDGELLSRLEALGAVCNPAPPRLADLPDALTARFISRHGRYMMRVYSKADIWDLKGIEQFVGEVRRVDSRATGNPLQIFEASRQMKRSYEEAALYALLVIVPLLLFDFRNLLHTVWAVLPLGLGMIQMFGLMGLLDIPLNPANMIVLPIILGIGIDNGVHIVHDFLQQGGSYRRMSSSTCMAIVINSLCNMVGFGSLMVASHQGLQSLGRVLTIGMACILANSLVLPNFLLAFCSQKGKSEGEETGDGRPDLSLEAPQSLEGLPSEVYPEHRRQAA
jgi:predicted RND superfamily exporter protein